MNNKAIFIIKTGTTFKNTKKILGDFDSWTSRAIGNSISPLFSVNAEKDEILPNYTQCAGVVITGSHSMVTNMAPWAENLQNWLNILLQKEIPVFGICYGHQLLAKTAKGNADFHPKGKEIGTKKIFLTQEGKKDILFKNIPNEFYAHTTHDQSVTELPPNAICLAYNDHEKNHAVRIGKCAWGVQFHPEYNEEIMEAYINEQKTELNRLKINIKNIVQDIRNTEYAKQLLKNFAQYAHENNINT